MENGQVKVRLRSSAQARDTLGWLQRGQNCRSVDACRSADGLGWEYRISIENDPLRLEASAAAGRDGHALLCPLQPHCKSLSFAVVVVVAVCRSQKDPFLFAFFSQDDLPIA